MAGNSADRLHIPEARQASFLETLIERDPFTIAWWLLIIASTVAVSLALFHLFSATFGIPGSREFRGIHLTGMLVLAILLKPSWCESIVESASAQAGTRSGLSLVGLFADGFLVMLILFVQIYTLSDMQAFQAREGALNWQDLVAGTTLTLIILEATRRTVGWPMVVITAFFLSHALQAHRFPGFFFGPPVSYSKLMDLVFVRSDGIFGVPLMVAATYIVLFVILGAMLVRSGASRFFLDLAVALTGHRRGGPAKASVVASAFLGTVSGSAVANVATTGVFTIPLMRKLGYSRRFAGAVEACASSGGQITPPIMGAAAFIIAEYLHVGYGQVLLAGVVPTLLYFATMYFMVDLEADKSGVEKIAKSRLPQVSDVLKSGWHHLLTLTALVVFLAAGFTPMMAAIGGIATLAVLSFVVPSARLSPVDFVAALESGVRNAMPVTIACACAGLIIGSIFASGLGLKFTHSVIELSGGNLLALLVLAALAAIILGMGMTTTAVYITVAALIAPALVEMGVTPMAAHLFAFYYGVVSTITPPVALAAFAAAGISGASPMRTAVTSARVGVAKYVVPFAFVYNPALLMEGSSWRMGLVSGIAALAGLWALSIALEGWYRGRPQRRVIRMLLIAFSIALLWPPTVMVFALPGYSLWVVALGGLAAYSRLGRRKAAGISA